MDFIAIDFETADASNSAPCSLAVTLVKNNQIEGTLCYLINPEEPFCDRKISVHRISESTVKNAPTFPDVWSNVEDLFSRYPIVAHNVSFDVSVLKKVAKKYNISLPSLTCYCTYELSKYNFPSWNRYSLSEVCARLSIPLESHHECGCDSLAAAKIMIHLLGEDFTIFPSDVNNSPCTRSTSHKKLHIPIMQFDDIDHIDFESSKFVLTGDFSSLSKQDIEQLISDRGGTVTGSVSKKTDYLIVGPQDKQAVSDKENLKSSKIIKSEILRASGHKIKIISREQFFSMLNNASDNPKDDKISLLKNLRLIPKTAKVVRPIYYNGVHSDGYVECEVIGCVNDIVAEISIRGTRHFVAIDYLREMQPTQAIRKQLEGVSDE